MHRDKWIVTGDKRAAKGEDIFYSHPPASAHHLSVKMKQTRLRKFEIIKRTEMKFKIDNGIDWK